MHAYFDSDEQKKKERKKKEIVGGRDSEPDFNEMGYNKKR
jgi:hypothetical protein